MSKQPRTDFAVSADVAFESHMESKADKVQVKLNLEHIPFDIRNENQLVLYFTPIPINDLDKFVAQFDLPIGDESNLQDAIAEVVQKAQVINVLRERLG